MGNLILKLMNEPIDQKKVYFKPVREKTQVFSMQTITRESLIREQEKNKEWAEKLMQKRAQEKMVKEARDSLKNQSLERSKELESKLQEFYPMVTDTLLVPKEKATKKPSSGHKARKS